MTATLEEALHTHLDRNGGVVVEKLVSAMRNEYSSEAPELSSVDALKDYIKSKPDTFRISTSVNGVERARLTNPRRASRGLIGLAVKALEELHATEESAAVSVDTLLEKVVALKTEKLDEGEDLPYDLANTDEFVKSAQRFARIRFEGDTVYLAPRNAHAARDHNGEDAALAGARPRRPRGNKGRAAPEAAGEGNDAEAPPRRRRPMGTPQEPQEITLGSDANDSTVIAHLVYKKLCERGAVNITVGLTTKMLLRLVSMDFKDMRPDSDPSSMHSLRIFKILLAQMPGLKRQRPRLQPRTNNRGPRPALEIIVWMDDENEIVKGIKEGLPDDLANATITPDVLDNYEELEEGEAQTVNVFDQESWNTSVVGPTSKTEVLQDFLEQHKEQSIWAVETEHRVGLRGRPAGKIAVIILSDMQHTIIWDVHQGGFPDCLKDFFANEKIFKGGVRIGPKGSKLKKQFDVPSSQLAELSVIAHILGLISDEEKERVSMRMMTQNVLEVPVSRPPMIRDSNWELRPLTKLQYKYAVEDGFATALLFMKMVASLHQSQQGHKLNEACVSVE